MENYLPEYPEINIEETGIQLKEKMDSSGYTVRELQEYLGLSCPQSIYRWFKGQALPAVGHLYALSLLFQVHIEELLVKK